MSRFAAILAIPAIALAAPPPFHRAEGTRLAERFRKADADGNGSLSRAEAQRSFARLAAKFDAIDANRDGQIGPEELRAHRRALRGAGRAGGAARTGLDEHFARADRDGDGALSLAEAQAGLPRIAGKFERIDLDRDGRLTREEIRAWLALRRAARAGKTG